MKAREAAVVIALFAALALQLGLAVVSDGLTNDELLYVPAGYLQVTRGDFSLNRTHPPLGPDLAGLGLAGAGVTVPERRADEDDLAYCWRFLHRENGGRALWQRARVPAVLLTLLLAAGLWLWAVRAIGIGGGLVALGLAAFHPTLLAHGHLATTDLPAAAGMVASAAAYWAWTRRPSRGRAALLGLAVGLALAVRVTSALVLPGFLVLELLAWRRGERRGRALVEAVAIGAVMVPLAIAASFGVARDGLAAYVEGFRWQLGHNRRGHLAYLLGRTSREGWPYYFVVALLVKSTPGFLLGLVAAAWAAFRRAADPERARPHWLLPAAFVFVSLSVSRIQIGERYLLPAHLFAVLLIASATPWLLDRLPGRIALAAILIAHVAPAILVAPRGYLAYFNLLAGGRRGAPHVLLDSNLDWGQDLPRLARWMRHDGVPRVSLAYDGADDPDRLGIARDDLPGRNHYAADASAPIRGTVVVSPSLVYGLVPREAERYAFLRERRPDARAGVFLVYRLP
jgi:hypothetical protein